MLTSEDIETLRDTIVEGVHPLQIFLFGPYAEGRATDDSDVDVVVVMDTELSQHQRNVSVKRLFPRRHFSLDAFVFAPVEFAKYKDVPGTLIYTASHQGMPLYG